MNFSFAWRIPIAAVAAFLFSALYYGLVVGTAWRELSGLPEAELSMWQPLAQIARNLVLAGALALVLRQAGVTRLGRALGLSLVLWLGFQAMAIAGSVIHERYPLVLYAIHIGDQLGTIIIMTLCLAAHEGLRSTGAAVPAGGR